MEGQRLKKPPSYRWRAFTHWLNLAFLGIGGAAAAIYDPSVLLAVLPLETGLMWIIPDLPSFRAVIDKNVSVEELMKERAYYIQQLWKLAPPEKKSFGQRFLGLFSEPDTVKLDTRIIEKHDPAFREYQEMTGIMQKLRDLEQVRGVHIAERDINRFDQVINGYLRYLVAERTMSRALLGVDMEKLSEEFSEVEERLKNAPANLKSVLLERKHIIESQLERVPKLQATLELFKTRAEAIVYQMRNILSQVLADPSMDVNTFLDELVERQEILSDPMSAFDVDQVLSQFSPTEVKQFDKQTAKAAAAMQASAGGKKR